MERSGLFRGIGLFFIALGFGSSAWGMPRPPVVAPQLSQETLCSLVAEKGVSGAFISIFNQGGVRQIGCGVRNKDSRDPVTAATVFEAASLSKPVFAYAVLELAREGRLDLDAPLSDYLPAEVYHWPDPFTRTGTPGRVDPLLLHKTTARQILQHMSGLPNWSDEPGLVPAGAAERWLYSGEGFVLLQRAIEHITAQPLDRWMESHVFRPLGMRSSSFRWQQRFLASQALGYDEHGAALLPAHYRYPLSPTTLYTTPHDYQKFVSVAFSAEGFKQFINPAPVPVNPTHALFWGMGVGIEDVGGTVAVLHGGSNPGYRAYLWYVPATRQGLLIFTNSDLGYNLVTPLVKLALPGVHPALSAPELHLPQ